ncbi:LppU/SCO3897 family protein [Streptomyces sp. NPDC000983]|uniref:LppU/SCO3897 family protein n=1 Tax=Streptomyces sp. NPDC000983 TaxID=3154373 RepID=UPI0033248E39
MTTPPPQGQNPFAQGQNPYAQPQGQDPQQPGFPQPGAAPYAPVPPEQPRRKLSFKTIKNIVVAVVVIGVVVGGYIASRDDADTAKVGDCMSISDPDSTTDPGLEVVDCSDSKARYKVAEKKDGTIAGCDRTKYSEYTETGGSKDFTLCLADYTAK